MIIIVFVFPPNESYNNLVNFESLYGICYVFPSTNAEITFPNADNDKLIFVASLSRSPVAYVFDYLSLPAKSTRFNLPAVILSLPFGSVTEHSMYTVKMQ